MELKQAKREKVKLRIGLSGASGSGKTYSAILLAYGIANDYSKIAIVDTENNSASLYSHLGNYKALNLDAPYTPEKYIKAIETCEKANMEVVIIDSISHEWIGTGGCLEIHHKLGGRFQDWAKVTPRHQSFIDKILRSNCHIITTARRKVGYSLNTMQNGRVKVVKLGTKEITREGFEYELTVNFQLLGENHLCKASKDRTGLFMNKPEFKINAAIGKRLVNWSNNDKGLEQAKEEIQVCETIEGLKHIYDKYPNYQNDLKADVINRKTLIESAKLKIVPSSEIVNNQNSENNDIPTRE
ncbi:AAA family ATPase [Seonamhaeicola marinus]|uniref:AAA family ATPase n=1 Tax=Seonamhaeicola marinus TaxID=1912246 RepID=A0A5D0HSB4_9FLAO|nr:AAA family ATPase [Seonamhaeicola marinus]TYA74234.1 AAA family ATPase [Seonamhaeicola marinus]